MPWCGWRPAGDNTYDQQQSRSYYKSVTGQNKVRPGGSSAYLAQRQLSSSSSSSAGTATVRLILFPAASWNHSTVGTR
jgi:hypothetical protein